MQRRRFLIGGAALLGVADGVARAAAPNDPPKDDLRTAAREGWIYGLALVEMARLRQAALGVTPKRDTPGFNSFAHLRAPAGPDDRDFSAPEADVLYSSAWLYLPADGAKITLPATGGTPFTLALFDMYGNAFHVVQGYEVGRHGHTFSLVGPPTRVGMGGYTAPLPRMPHLVGQVVRAPGPWVWALARIHVANPRDLIAAHAIQDGLAVHARPERPRPVPAVSPAAGWGDYFFYVQKLIEESPPSVDEQLFFRRIAALQLGPTGDFEKARFSDTEMAEAEAGVAEARTLAFDVTDKDAAALGWMWPKYNVGDYGQDFLSRARTVFAETATLPRTSAIALRAVAADGALDFPSHGHYRLALPPPPGAPWSLTLYEAGEGGRQQLSANPIGRHFLGSASPGLRRRADGGYDIWIGRNDPNDFRSANWLPAPDQEEAFSLILRAYSPRDAMLDHRYRPGPVTPIGRATIEGQHR